MENLENPSSSGFGSEDVKIVEVKEEEQEQDLDKPQPITKNLLLPPKDIEVGLEYFRPWMIAQRRARNMQRRNMKRGPPNTRVMKQKSIVEKYRFEILNDEEQKEMGGQEGKPHGLKSKPRKREMPKKPILVAHINPANKRSGRVPSERANKHTVVTSNSGGIKSLGSITSQKSSSKGG
ncbi:uncharacterized protein G2W53_009610 [Senna tora]|uniref:Uncharacterized protein n=1 Tax=Senna tora TaxID=362788 RepID=A0A835CAC5_9FABA|nr:uncharacterized protein G2W53_009610 [Senna tora]